MQATPLDSLPNPLPSLKWEVVGQDGKGNLVMNLRAPRGIILEVDAMIDEGLRADNYSLYIMAQKRENAFRAEAKAAEVKAKLESEI